MNLRMQGWVQSGRSGETSPLRFDLVGEGLQNQRVMSAMYTSKLSPGFLGQAFTCVLKRVLGAKGFLEFGLDNRVGLLNH